MSGRTMVKMLGRRAARLVQVGPRRVVWTQPNGNLGNFLYEWMHVFHHRLQGEDVVCLRTAAMEPWLPQFGRAASDLVVERRQVSPFDRRDPEVHNEFGVHFDEAQLAEFIDGFIVPSGLVGAERVPADLRLGAADVLVNVRRGDYYSDPTHRANYSFDVHEYLDAALRLSQAQGGAIDRLLVVSDGIDWCAEHLGWLRRRCRELVFEDRGLKPAVHLALLANSPRLILTNSTFSYWGAYLSGHLSGRPSVVAPWFHVRHENGGAAWQLDPRWQVVRDLPSGWAPR